MIIIGKQTNQPTCKPTIHPPSQQASQTVNKQTNSQCGPLFEAFHCVPIVTCINRTYCIVSTHSFLRQTIPESIFDFSILFRPMDFSVKLYTIKSEWSIVCNEGSQDFNSKKCISLKIANSEDPDEMLHLKCNIM